MEIFICILIAAAAVATIYLLPDKGLAARRREEELLTQRRHENDDILIKIGFAKQDLQKVYDEIDRMSQRMIETAQLDSFNSVNKIQEAADKRIHDIADKLEDYESRYMAMLNQQQQEERLKADQDFYRMVLTENENSDIIKLVNWSKELHDPTILQKLIWSTFYLKRLGALTDRVLGDKTVCGIYKITNRVTNRIYVGQSKNIKTRWTTHIKTALGVEGNSNTKLYEEMRVYGITNFTFELIEECESNKLNERERYWIGFFHSDTLGLNSTMGG